MEDKRTSYPLQSNDKNDLPCIKKIIKHQEELYRMSYRAGKWIRKWVTKKKLL